jgi:hypothetical protein
MLSNCILEAQDTQVLKYKTSINVPPLCVTVCVQNSDTN